MKPNSTTQTNAVQNKTALSALEPRGTRIVLHNLLRWQLAAAYIPLESRSNSSQLSGTQRSTLRGRGIDFDEVRLYQAGDDVRSVDWRVTARTGKMHTKIFHEEKERPVLLVIDLRSGMYFGSRRCFKSVLAANAAALLAWAAVASGDRIGALLISDNGVMDIKPQRSRHTLLQLFRQIIALDEQHASNTPSSVSTPWQQAMQQLRVLVRPGTCVIMLSDFHDWNTQCQQALHPVVRHSQCFAIHIHDILEKQLPAIGLVNLRSGNQTIALDTQDTQRLAHYQQQRQHHYQTVAAAMRTLKIPLLALQTDAGIFSSLRQFFTAGKQAGATDER
ncbi:MAG: DUF58 domain-containing protein [Cellvibrionales bacterium]|jgi:uncharacterized protein (DUF58 family)|nr:DUF58 domain-containing protein [Cellvibrionales bacterium]MBK8675645.1 DUF58 domain-containing protein [Cellvibrionales bacterium]HRG50830.1 DUF58 domain-containing protein [Pseudomonadales bacterium]